MLNANAHKNFTASGDKEAEMLLGRVLSEIGETLSGTGLCVVLGGSYGRGDGGVRVDKENGILYNDLDFFVFGNKKSSGAGKLLHDVAVKYEKELKVDVDFSAVMSVRGIKNNAPRLMMQELRRGYRLVCGEDLLEKHLPEFPPEQIPFSEACRLLLNRGMGLLLAGEKIYGNSGESDFILRNINKAILGCCDALLIARKNYKWQIDERVKSVAVLDLPESFKEYYAGAVGFKKSPSREMPCDVEKIWRDVRDMFRRCITEICGENCGELASHCRNSGEISLKNWMKYCIKSRSFPVRDWQFYTMPAVTALIPELDEALANMPRRTVSGSKFYQQWLIFN
jgi:hypothetical protein